MDGSTDARTDVEKEGRTNKDENGLHCIALQSSRLYSLKKIN